MELLPFVGVALVGVLALSGVLWFERRRWQYLSAFARAQGWELVDRDDAEVERPGEPFERGHGRRAEEVLRGVHRGRAFTAFSYSFRTTSTDAQGRPQTRTHRYAVVAVRLPAFVPGVELQPAGLVDRFLDLGVQLESEEFNSRYRLRGDPRLAHDLLPPTSVALLLDRPSLSLRLLGAEAVSWEPGRLDPEDVLVRLETTGDVLDGVPAWVWRDLGGA